MRVSQADDRLFDASLGLNIFVRFFRHCANFFDVLSSLWVFLEVLHLKVFFVAAGRPFPFYETVKVFEVS